MFSRAELATEEFLPVEDVVLENFIFVKGNKEYKVEKKKSRWIKKWIINQLFKKFIIINLNREVILKIL